MDCIELIIDDRDNIELVVADSNVKGVPSGGAKGQALVKATDDDYDFGWRNFVDPKDGILTIQANGVPVATFAADSEDNVTADISIPTKTSDIVNDSGYMNGDDVGDAIDSAVSIAIAEIVNAAPSALDTLNELAEALNNDPNFASTVASQIGEKVDKDTDAVAGNIPKYDSTGNLVDSGVKPDDFLTDTDIAGKVDRYQGTPGKILKTDASGYLQLANERQYTEGDGIGINNNEITADITHYTSVDIVNHLFEDEDLVPTYDYSASRNKKAPFSRLVASVWRKLKNKNNAASASEFGLVKVDNATTTVDANGVLHAAGGEALREGDGISIDGGTVSLDVNGLDTGTYFDNLDQIPFYDKSANKNKKVQWDQFLFNTKQSFHMQGATEYADGVEGFVPMPQYGKQNYFLRGDGTWQIPETGYEKPSSGIPSSDLSNEVKESLGGIDEHISSTDNPHEVTAEQIGLGNVDNTADADKPISTAMQSALNGKVDATLVKTAPSANNKILTEADSVDSPPEVHIGDTEPTGDEVVWYNPDEEDEDEPIDIASVDYVDEKVADKQDTLIPGDNITIVDNVISASGGIPLDPDSTVDFAIGYDEGGLYIVTEDE